MSDFDIVDLAASSVATRGSDKTRTSVVGRVDSAEVAAGLAALRDDLGPLFEDNERLRLKSLVIKLTVSAEGKVAFVAKGAVEASIELTFERS